MPNNMRAIRVENPGPEYRLVLDETVRPVPGSGEVLIRVAAAGVNRADLLQAAGRYPPPPDASPILGMEVAGDIIECGEQVRECRVGDSVCALLPGGGYAEFCVAPATSVLPVPNRVAVKHAAALPEAYFTVWTNLMDSARLASGERVLIHGGSSGIGTAAIQLCSALGHDVFATAGSADKCAACEQLGARRAINYRNEDFVDVIEQATGGKGVDVILDMVGGDYIERNFRALARCGRLVNIAFQKGTRAEVNFAPMLLKRLSFLATTLRGRSNQEKNRIRDAVRARVWPLLETGRIRPVVDQQFPLSEAQAAHEKMRSSRHIGKILLAI
ncbi:MAG TPA: NAD(P)H-quinone oxidoreductase [Rhizomicrobium sp.]|jgi:NADPH2:quinone reductase|nr:NAD(P)H-quinone oxidoreductase [Rhizomicrobium sp.]